MNSIENQDDPTGPEVVNRELQALVERYPRLFRGELPPRGCEMPQDRIEYLGRLCQDIDTRLSDDQAQQFRLLQFRESEGAFRVYWHIAEPDSADFELSLETLQVLTDSAEAVADSTCYFLGAAGQMRYLGGWFKLESPGEAEPDAAVTAEVTP